MIRPFDIRDVSTIQRLSPLGQAMAYEPVAVDGLSPLREALRSYASGGIDNRLTLVRRSSDHDAEVFGVLQLMDNPDDSAGPRRFGVLLYMAPAPRSEEAAATWADLAEAVVAQAAARGAVHVIAEAPDDGYEAGALQSLGFSPLIHQDVMKLTALTDKSAAAPAAAPVPGLREQQDSDEAHIRLLAMRAVPKIIQKAETSSDLTRLTHRMECGFVLFQGGELAGHVSFRRGRRAYGMHALFHTSAEEHAPEVLRHALARVCGLGGRRPVYCTVPSYQSWLLPCLDRLGFGHITSNVLMIKHTTATVQQPVWSLSGKTAGKAVPTKPNAQHARNQNHR